MFEYFSITHSRFYGMEQRSRTELITEATGLVGQSHLSAADKQMLSGRIPFAPDSVLSMFVTVCEEDPFGIDAVVRNLKKKLDAQGNLSKIHEIVKQESKDIEALIDSHALIA